MKSVIRKNVVAMMFAMGSVAFANADVISVNFQGKSGIAANAGEGVIPANIWNEVVGATQTTTTNVPLVSENNNNESTLSYYTTDSITQNVGDGILRGGVTSTSPTYNGLRSWAAVDNIPFDFYDVIIYSTGATSGYFTPTFNGLNLNGKAEVIPLITGHTTPRDLATCVEEKNVVYVRHALTAKKMKMVAQWGLTKIDPWYTGQGGFAAFQIVEVPQVPVSIASNTSLTDLNFSEVENREVRVLNVANDVALSVSSDSIAAVDALKNSSYFISFAENGKLNVTLAEGKTSIRIRTKNLKPENLSVSLYDGSTPENLYLSYLDEYVQISTESLTFGDCAWITEDETNVKWMWKGSSDTSWQTVESLEQLSAMQMTARFEGYFATYSEPPTVNISDINVVGDVVRIQAKYIDNADVKDGSNVSLGAMKSVKIELSLSDGVITAKGIECRTADTQDFATDIWSAGAAPKPAFLAQSSITGFCGIYDFQVLPNAIVRDSSGSNHTTLQHAFDNLNNRNLKALMFTEDLTITESVSYPNGIEYSVADGKSIVLSSGVTLTLGLSRIDGNIEFVDSTSCLAMQISSPSEVLIVKTSSDVTKSNFRITNGLGIDVTSEYSLTPIDGGYEIKAFVPEIIASGETSLDNTIPATGNVKIKYTGDTVLTFLYPRTYGTVLVEGNGTLYITGANVSASEFALSSGVELILDGTSNAITVPSLISGSGSLRTKGNVMLGGNNTFTGGIIVESGILSISSVGGFGSGVVTVCDGASVDIANSGENCEASFIVTGQGVNNNGAIFSTGEITGDIANRIAGLELLGDTLIRADNSWGIKPPNGVEFANFAQNGFTLTKKGLADFSVQNILRSLTDGIGKIVCEEGSLTWGNSSIDNPAFVDIKRGSTLTYANTFSNTKAKFVLNEGTTFDVPFMVYQSKSPSFNFYPSVEYPIVFTGTGSFGRDVNNYLNRIWESQINAGNDRLRRGETCVLIENRMTTYKLENSMVYSFKFGTRYNYAVSSDGKSLTVTMNPLANVFHYDFDGDGEDWFNNVKGKAAANDSTYYINSENAWPNNVANPVRVPARNGYAILVGSGTGSAKFRPMWSASTYNTLKTILSSGAATITSVLKPVATDKRYIWSFGSNGADYSAVALVVENDNTLSVLCKNAPVDSWEVYASVSNIVDLTTKEHFVAVRLNGFGTTLIVDDKIDVSGKFTPELSEDRYRSNGRSGSLGSLSSINSKYLDYSPMPEEGYYLNDWRVFDTSLTDNEINKIRKEFWTTGFSVIVR